MSERFPRRTINAVAVIICLTTIAAAQTGAESGAALLAKLDCPDRVKGVAFSPDGKLLAAGFGWSHGGGVRIWNVADRTVVANPVVGKGEGSNSNFSSVAFSNDGKLFAAANWNGEVFLWTVGAWRTSRRLPNNRGEAKSLNFSSDNTKLALASEDAIVVYDLKTTAAVTFATKTADRDRFTSATFSPDTQSLIICRDSSVEIWDVSSRKQVKTWKPAGFGFFGGVSPDGNHIIAGGGSVYGKKHVEIWNTNNGERVGELSDFRSGLFALAISHTGKLFAVSGGDYGGGGDLSLWNLNTAKELGFLSFGRFPIQALAFSPDDGVLAAGSDDGCVLLYSVDRIQGAQAKTQDFALCGEIEIEGDKAFIVPLSTVPRPMRDKFEYPWKLAIENADSVAGLAGLPVALKEWDLVSSAGDDRARINKFERLRPAPGTKPGDTNHIVVGDIQNPGWNKGVIAKIYGDGSFVVSNTPGRCLAYGSLDQLKTDFDSVKTRLVGEGLLAIPRGPLTIGTDHYRTRFIALSMDGLPEWRSDADDFEVLMKGGPSKKREAFARLIDLEQPFIDALVHAGMKAPSN